LKGLCFSAPLTLPLLAWNLLLATYSPSLLLLHFINNPGLARPGTNVAASSIAPAASGK